MAEPNAPTSEPAIAARAVIATEFVIATKLSSWVAEPEILSVATTDRARGVCSGEPSAIRGPLVPLGNRARNLPMVFIGPGYRALVGNGHVPMYRLLAIR